MSDRPVEAVYCNGRPVHRIWAGTVLIWPDPWADLWTDVGPLLPAER